MKKLLAWLLIAAAVAVGLLAAAYDHFMRSDAVIGDEPVAVEIARGEHAAALFERLVSEGVLDASPLWRLAIKLERPGACLQAGLHELEPDLRPREVFAMFCETTRAPGVRLTVPEGTNLYQLADVFAGAGMGEREDVLARGFDAEFARSLGVDAPSLEGYLAPDTHEFPLDATAEDVLRRLAEEGEAMRERAFEAVAAGSGDATAFRPWEHYTGHELLTIASIVEEEAQVDDERPIIARVIYNRIERGMQIQCDPTCIYRPDAYDQVPTRALCRDPESTHSTYVLPGLPPTPISNPGHAALEATLAPADDPNVLYFVAMRDGTGRHAFARTLAEHERNVTQYLRR
jgi:UPF0755 protein